ncbi:hypothetical protein A2U01_0025172, partial [Trifolium medium]|nr:hypothetical protein [Trifolium medium]
AYSVLVSTVAVQVASHVVPGQVLAKVWKSWAPSKVVRGGVCFAEVIGLFELCLGLGVGGIWPKTVATPALYMDGRCNLPCAGAGRVLCLGVPCSWRS